MVIGLLGILPQLAVIDAVRRSVEKLPTKGRDLPTRKRIKKVKTVRKKGGRYEGLAW